MSKLFCKTTESFIKEASLIHNHIYDYTDVVYIDALQKVKINCIKHGEF